MAADLDPASDDVLQRRVWVIVGDAKGTPEELAQLEAAVRDNADDFRAVQALGFALAKKRDYKRVVELWTTFVASHPDEGAAYLERGGALFRMEKRKEAVKDAAKACELGVSLGCVYAKKLGG